MSNPTNVVESSSKCKTNERGDLTGRIFGNWKSELRKGIDQCWITGRKWWFSIREYIKARLVCGEDTRFPPSSLDWFSTALRRPHLFYLYMERAERQHSFLICSESEDSRFIRPTFGSIFGFFPFLQSLEIGSFN